MSQPIAPPEFDSRDLTSFALMRELVNEFEGVLRRHGISIQPKSPLEAMCIELSELENRRIGHTPVDPMLDMRKEKRSALGLHDLIRRIVKLSVHPGFPVFVPHLRLLNSG